MAEITSMKAALSGMRHAAADQESFLVNAAEVVRQLRGKLLIEVQDVRPR